MSTAASTCECRAKECVYFFTLAQSECNSRGHRQRGGTEESERGREKVFCSLLTINNFPARLESLPSTFTQDSAIDGHNSALFLPPGGDSRPPTTTRAETNVAQPTSLPRSPVKSMHGFFFFWFVSPIDLKVSLLKDQQLQVVGGRLTLHHDTSNSRSKVSLICYSL